MHPPKALGSRNENSYYAVTPPERFATSRLSSTGGWNMHALTVFLLLLCAALLHQQVQQFPYIENFDGVVAPALPSGWSTSANRVTAGDFTTTTSAYRSDSNAVISTN